MKKLILGVLLVCSTVFAEKITVFAASSTKLAITEVAELFKKANPDAEVDMYYSATGKAFAQFTNGFKYDLFFAANMEYAEAIAKQGDAISDPKPFVLGTVALYSHNPALVAKGLGVLGTPEVKKISIANPRVAPYGIAAMQIIENAGLSKAVEGKIAQGENIGQSVQFVDTGAADIGLVAFSLIKNKAKPEEYIEIDQALYEPIKQGFVVTKYGKNNNTAFAFADFVFTKEAQDVFVKYGFGVPQ